MRNSLSLMQNCNQSRHTHLTHNTTSGIVCRGDEKVGKLQQLLLGELALVFAPVVLVGSLEVLHRHLHSSYNTYSYIYLY
jgi:hypothetical protein